MWAYVQRTGLLIAPDGKVAGGGYAGRGAHKNDPFAQRMKNEGPLPCGMYTIGPSHQSSKVGPFAMHLIPDADNTMFGRGDFMLHGDSISSPGNASDGCIIQNRPVRIRVGGSIDRRLRVVAETKDLEEPEYEDTMGILGREQPPDGRSAIG